MTPRVISFFLPPPSPTRISLPRSHLPASPYSPTFFLPVGPPPPLAPFPSLNLCLPQKSLEIGSSDNPIPSFPPPSIFSAALVAKSTNLPILVAGDFYGFNPVLKKRISESSSRTFSPSRLTVRVPFSDLFPLLRKA